MHVRVKRSLEINVQGRSLRVFRMSSTIHAWERETAMCMKGIDCGVVLSLLEVQ